jgi:hypothetical protein
MDKLIKSQNSTKRRDSILSNLKKIQDLDERRLGIKTQKAQIIAELDKIPRKLSHKQSESYVSKLGLDKVSPVHIPQKPTKLDKANLPILQPDNLDMLAIKDNPDNQDNPDNKLKLDDYIIVIPSYNRPEMIQSKTLALLHQHNIPVNKIKIFVADKDQAILYKNKIPKHLYSEIIIGVLGLKNQRNFIMDYYKEGQHIVQLDDDLEKIMELEIKTVDGQDNDKKRILIPIRDLDGFIKEAFRICVSKGIYLWGVYPLANERFMFPRMTTDLRFIVGPMWGIINRHLPELKLTIDEKENAERTLQHYTIDGAVLRFNYVGIQTKYYKNKGGMQNEGKNRKDEALKSVYYLHKKYPQLTKIYLGKKSGIPEIKMITGR